MIGQRTTPHPGRRARARMARGRALLVSWLTANDPLAPSSPRAEARRFWLAWGVFLVAAAFALACLATAWWTGLGHDWMWYWGTVLVMAFTAFGPIFLRNWLPDTRRREGITELLNAITRGDPNVAPAATRQPPALTPAELAAISGQSVAVYQPRAITRAQLTYLAVFYILIGLLGLAQNLGSFISSPLSGWPEMVYDAFFLTTGPVSGALVLAWRRPISVSATENGLMWREPNVWGGWRRARTMPWHDLRAFSVFNVPQGTTHDGSDAAFTLFAALGPRDALTWTLWTKAYHQRRGRPARGQEDPAWRLARLIVSYTGQTLRDPTDTAVRLFQVPGPATTPQPRLQAISPWLAGSMALIVALAGVALLIAQPGAYAARFAQAGALAPLYADPLSAPTGDWPQGANPGGTYQYHNGAYILTEGTGDYCCDIYAWPARTFASATVEVAVRQTTDFNLSAAGLILRADDASGTMLVFTVTTGGEWHLDRFHYTPNQAGASDEQTLLYVGVLSPVGAIHKGSGAVNDLAAVVRGTTYVLYINQQFVGVYQDSGLFASGPRSGHFGVYADGLATSAAFSNFRVYPALAPTPLAPA